MSTEVNEFEYSPSKKILRITENGNDNEASSSKLPELKTKKKSSKDSNFARDYLMKHGFTEGKGLGKHQDGIVEPVEASKQRGTRGFGYTSVKLETSASKFDPSLERVSPDEEVNFLKNEYKKSLSRECLESWVTVGPPKKCIDENSYFCDAEVASAILTAKNSLGELGKKEMKNGRRRANPFESIQNGIFLNRAAMKMANLDAILDKMFTEPKYPNGEPVLRRNELLYFADVCAGPGGFSEYVLFRKKWRAKGFGFTLKGDCDFQLDKFQAGSPETFDPHYGVTNDGNVFLPENITSFKEHVLKYTDCKGVHFMMADGGVHIDEKLNDQELVCKKLYLCQCLVALHVVRAEGHFVVKLFDLFTEFSVGLLYLMYRSFREISIIKPVTSRPANSERYLVCRWKREDSADIAEFLFDINQRVPLHDDGSEEDVLELVPLDVLREDKKFYDYIRTSNETLGRRQANSLYKLVAYCENDSLKDDRQQELRQICLKKWDVPDEARADAKKYDSSFLLTEFKDDAKNYVKSKSDFREKVSHSALNWHAVVVCGLKEANSFCGLYMGLGRNNIKKYASKKWLKADCGMLCLPPKTLIYGEVLYEYSGSGSGQLKTYALHIIDGMVLGGEDIRNLPYSYRWERCQLFAKALTKRNCPVRVKEYYPMMEMDRMWDKLEKRPMKARLSGQLGIPLGSNKFYSAGGVIFIRDTRDPWNRHLSKTKKPYLYDSMTKASLFEESVQSESWRKYYGDFEYCLNNRMIWLWEDKVMVHPSQSPTEDPSKLQRTDVEEVILEHQ